MPAALLIIDVQQALSVGKYAMFEVDRVIERINDVSRRARAADSLVIVVQHESERGQGMEYATEEWKLAPALEVDASDIFIRKRASDAFHETALHEALQIRGIDTLVVCGMQSDFCVDSTVRRALGLGYPVVLVSDAHTTMDNGVLTATQIVAHHNQTLSNLDSYGVLVTLQPSSTVQVH
jgi:nicotinamidase-related amidase